MNKNNIIAIISVLGIIFTSYMTYIHYQPNESVCLLGGNQCTQIIQGVYSEILGIPASVMGLFIFVLLFFFAFTAKSEEASKNLFWTSLIGVFAAGYFNYIMAFKLGSFCPWCELSHISYITIFFLSCNKLKRFVIYTLIFFLLGALISYLANASGQYDDFAKCLTGKNATFYGAFWCPHCNDQKALLGKSMRYVSYVECSLPNGSQNDFCNKQKINGYPTWDFNGERVSGVLSIAELSRLSKCSIK